jgi:hypothetical protein
MASYYKIRPTLAIPLAFTFLLFLILLCIALLLPAVPGEPIFVAIALFIVSYLLLEVLYRRVALLDEGLHIRKFLRGKELAWHEITHLGSVVLGAKVYLLLTTTRGFYILTNNYEKFTELLGYLRDKLGSEKTDESIQLILERPRNNNQPVLLAWITVVILLAVISGRLFSHK